jgi:hypothetical protein
MTATRILPSSLKFSLNLEVRNWYPEEVKSQHRNRVARNKTRLKSLFPFHQDKPKIHKLQNLYKASRAVKYTKSKSTNIDYLS